MPGAGGRGSGVGGRGGITLIELLVAMAIAGMMVAIAYPSLTGGLDGIRLRTAGQSVAAFLNNAHGRAERDQAPVEVLIDPGRNQMSAQSLDGKWERAVNLAEGVRIAEVRPAAEPGPRRFVILPGVPAPGVRVRLETFRGRSLVAGLDPVTGVPLVEEDK